MRLDVEPRNFANSGVRAFSTQSIQGMILGRGLENFELLPWGTVSPGGGLVLFGPKVIRNNFLFLLCLIKI